VQKDQGEGVRLTEGLWGPGLRRREEDDDVWRRKGSALAEEAAAGVAGVLGWCRSAPGTPVEVAEGSGRRGAHRRRAISAAVDLPAAVLRGKFRPRNGPKSRVKGAGAPGW
jgi:hypothetical protein